jgi:hypothetical protein
MIISPDKLALALAVLSVSIGLLCNATVTWLWKLLDGKKLTKWQHAFGIIASLLLVFFATYLYSIFMSAP